MPKSSRPVNRTCFNPLPPSRTGETRLNLAHKVNKISFNPLPPSRTGETFAYLREQNVLMFQSTPAV